MIEFLTEHPSYVVLACVLLIWAGIAYYLWRIDSSMTILEKSKQK